MRADLRLRHRKALLLAGWIAVSVLSGHDQGVLAQEPALRWDGLIELVSGRYDYPPPTTMPPTPADGPSQMSRHATSGDGRYIVFTANAANLGYSETALFIRDRRLSETRVLLAGPALDPAISADGNHVAFRVCEPYMRPDGAAICDVWSLDLRTWSWTVMSATTSGVHGDADSGEPVLSGNGRFVVFHTKATNLDLPNPEGIQQLVLRDRDPDLNGVYDEPGSVTLEIVSAPDGAPGTVGGNAASETAEVSDAGRYVAFRSAATNLVPGDTNGGWDVFRRDRLAQQTRRLNVRPWPEGANESPNSIDSPAISMTPDGRYVAFTSADGQLSPGAIDDYNGVNDVLVFDAQGPALERLDIGWGPPIAMGYVPGNGPTEWPTLSADGRYVSLQSAASNVETPPSSGGTHTYVVDRVARTATRIGTKVDGTEPDRDCVRPSIAADGTLVTFMSQAFNLTPNVFTEADRIYAAVHFDVMPAEVFVPGVGGIESFTITTQQHTQWWVDWSVNWPMWLYFENQPWGVGNGTASFRAADPNPDPTPRSATIRFFGRSVVFTQREGLSLTGISPAEGPDTGGTQVTVTGTGFEPGMRLTFDGFDAVIESITPTTIVATTPAHVPGTVWIAVFSSGPDGRVAWIDAAFRYIDTSPPIIWNGLSGTEGQGGWFTSDVSVNWAWMDPESTVAVVSGCEMTTVTTDTPGTPFTCTVASEGGTASTSVTVKRDATGPSVNITTPHNGQLLERGATVPSAFTCADSLSGMGTCGFSAPQGAPVDTSQTGRFTFWADGRDVAGNFGANWTEYAVSTGVCSPMPDGLRTWMKFDGNLSDVMSTASSLNTGMPPDTYVPGKSGQAYKFVTRSGNAIEHWHDGRDNFGSAMSIALWLNPANNSLGTLVKNRDQYRIERTNAGAINWTLAHPGIATSFGTSSPNKVPMGVWTHVVFTYDAGEVKVYINGQPDRTWNTSDSMLRSTTWNRIRFGGPDEWGGWTYVGALDEVQLFNRALTASEVEGIFFAGAAGVCAPAPVTLEVPSPIQATYGAGTYPGVAILRDSSGAALAGKTLRLTQSVFGVVGDPTPTTTLVTDTDGMVRWDAPFNAPVGTYPSGFRAFFEGDSQHAHSTFVSATVIVQKATPQITWASPAPITYGTALSYALQLNATANVPGSFSYSPGSGSVPAAGTRTLNVTFFPSNSQNYQNATASVILEVAKATPSLSISGGTFTYDGQAHGATAAATDYLGRPLSPVAITYDGSPDAPVNAGVYTATASYAGDANHLPRTASATITITKATPSITTPSSTVFTYDGQPHGVTSNVYGLGGALLGQATITYNGSPNPPVDAATYTAVASFEGNTNYAARSITFTVRINPATPTVTVSGGPFTYDRQPHAATVTVTGVGGQALGAAVVTYNGAPDLPVNAGTYTVSASFPASGNYASASGSGTLVINKAAPVVTVTDSTFTYGSGPFQASATATGAGGEVLGPLAFTYNGTHSLPFTAGTYSVVATYAGSANYTAATGTGTLAVRKATPIFIVGGGTATYDGQPHPAGVILAGHYGDALGPYTVTYNGSSDPPVNAGTYAVEATYAGADNYEAATATGTLTIQPAVVALTVTGGTFTYDAQPHPATVSATGIGGEPLAPVLVTYNGSSAAPVSGGTYAVSATFAGSMNYAAVTKTATVTINPAWPTVSATGGEFAYDGEPHPASASATGLSGEALSPVNISYWRDGFGPIEVPITVGTYEVTAHFPGSANYFPKAATTTLVIGRATPTVTVTGGSLIYDGQPHPATGTVTGVGGATIGPLTFTYNGSTQVPVNAGSYSVVATFPGNATYQPASASMTITIGKATAALNWNQPAGITYGTPLGAGQLNATSNVAGTFVYAPAAGVALPAGTHALTATFTPADANNYGSGSVGQLITVSPAPLTIRANDAVKPFGAPLPALSAFAVGFVNGDSLASLTGALGFSTTATPQSAVGSYPIVPSGVAGVNYTIAFVPGALAVVKGGVAVSVTSSPAPSGLDQLMTFTATVGAAAPAAGTPSGTIQFFDGTRLLGSAALSSGSASLTTAGLSAGAHAIEARYDGDDSFESGTGSSSHTINSASATPSITISSNRNPATTGQSVTLTANISMSAGPVAGTLQFYDGATLLGSGTIASGRVTFITTAFAAGSHAITVRYLGSPSAPPVRSGVFVQAVGPSTWKNRTATVAVTASPNPSGLDDEVTITANVTGSTSTMPTGTMLFMINGEVTAAVAISPVSGSTARATVTLSGLAGGRHRITATYLGNSTYKGSTAAVDQTVN
jgi:Concanavalin A-like lectin/glucanases superfamily/MBG domain (YGX type)/Bacterial Ig-like domain (group 3)/IPT/TIG domain/MBG domain